jgi:hypothetical protein
MMKRSKAKDKVENPEAHFVKPKEVVLEQDANMIDEDIRIARGGFDRTRTTQIVLHRMDLADIAERLQMSGKVRPADRDANTIAALGERARHGGRGSPEPPKTVTSVSVGIAVIPRSWVGRPPAKHIDLLRTGE